MTLTFGYADSNNGARICYAMEPGAGTPVLHVLHSFYPCASVLGRHSGSMALSRGLAGGAGWYMFDWRGSGKSTKPPGAITFTDLVDDVEAVASAIGDPAEVIAVNDGCGVALAFAARRPEMVRRMLLVAPQGQHARAEAVERASRAWQADPVGTLAQELRWVHPGSDPEESFRTAREALAAKPVEMVAALARAAAQADLLALAPLVTAPTLLLHTQGDAEDALDVATRMPFGRTVDWTGIGDGTINGVAWRRVWDELIPPPPPLPTITGAAITQSSFRTILFTDLEGHTAMMSRLGDAKGREVLREHERITREALAAHDGREIKTAGDGFMASFGSAQKALECASALQRSLEGGIGGQHLRVRIGINAGEPIEEDDDLFGASVIAAARIAAKAEGGQVLVADVVRQLVAGKDFLFHETGEHLLKGMEDPVCIWQLRWEAS